MRRLLWALAGLVLGAGGVLLAGIALPYVTPISQAEGAYAMGLVFFWMPVGAIFGAILGALFGPRRR